MPRATLRPLALGGLALLSLVGCGRYRADAAHARYCAANPGAVELLLEGPPDRAYRVVGIVDAPSDTPPGRRARNNQINACRLGADAIVDDSAHGRGLAIQYLGVDDADPRQGRATVAVNPGATTVIGPTWTPAEETTEPEVETTDGPIQIQTNGGIIIQAPSIEVRNGDGRPSVPPMQ